MKQYVYPVFLRLPCESIPPRQRFHLADKLITAKMFNAHVRPARTVHAYFSDDLHHANSMLFLAYTYKVKYTLSLRYLRLLMDLNLIKLNLRPKDPCGDLHILEPGVSKLSFFVHADLSVSYCSVYLRCRLIG